MLKIQNLNMDKSLIAAVVLSILATTDSARILGVFPTPSISHQVVLRTVTLELVKRGHKVVVITPDPAYPSGGAPANLTEIDVHDVSYNVWRNGLLSADLSNNNDIVNQFRVFLKLFGKTFEKQLQTKAVQDIIKNVDSKSFDLIMVETCVRPALAFSHIYKAPVISISSSGSIFGMNSIMGSPTHPLFYPTITHKRLYNLSYWEKLRELFYHYYVEHVYDSMEEDEMKMLKKYFGSNLPQYRILFDNIEMFFQNVYPMIMDNLPVPPTVIFMGGVHIKAPKPLPEDLKSYLNNSTNGVIYVSFGSNVRTALFPPEKIKMLINVFSKLPYDVLWKMDSNYLPEKTDNIKVVQWLPQADLLRHPKIKAFITQGGLQSTDEAIAAAVPLIGLPNFGDQWFNVEKYVRHKIGVYLEWSTVTEAELSTAIRTVTEDESYRENVKRFREILNDRPHASLENAIWWVEYVIRHGGAKHLRSPAANISWMQYYQLDLIAIIVISLILLIVCLSQLFDFIWLKSKVCVNTVFNRIKIKQT